MCSKSQFPTTRKKEKFQHSEERKDYWNTSQDQKRIKLKGKNTFICYTHKKMVKFTKVNIDIVH